MKDSFNVPLTLVVTLTGHLEQVRSDIKACTHCEEHACPGTSALRQAAACVEEATLYRECGKVRAAIGQIALLLASKASTLAALVAAPCKKGMLSMSKRQHKKVAADMEIDAVRSAVAREQVSAINATGNPEQDTEDDAEDAQRRVAKITKPEVLDFTTPPRGKTVAVHDYRGGRLVKETHAAKAVGSGMAPPKAPPPRRRPRDPAADCSTGVCVTRSRDVT